MGIFRLIIFYIFFLVSFFVLFLNRATRLAVFSPASGVARLKEIVEKKKRKKEKRKGGESSTERPLGIGRIKRQSLHHMSFLISKQIGKNK